MSRDIYPLACMTVIVLLSLFVAYVLFGILSSTGIIKNDYVEFGGAAAGFFATLYLLRRWYKEMGASERKIEELQEENRELQEENEKLKDELGGHIPPGIGAPPPNYTMYVDYEHSMLLCHPITWKSHPFTVRLERVFSEDPLILHPSDEFPGQFRIAIATPGLQTYSPKDVFMMANDFGISVETVEKKLGIKLSKQHESLGIPFGRVLELLGAEGQNRREKIYSLEYKYLEKQNHKIIRKHIEWVDGRESLVVEREFEQGVGEHLVFFTVFTYVEEKDLIFTWQFIDNFSDRDKIDLIRRKILGTVKFWEPFLPKNVDKIV